MNEIPSGNFPKSVIKGPGLVLADLSSLEGKGEILSVYPRCFLIGIAKKPYMLFMTPEFCEGDFPNGIDSNVFEVKKVVVQPTFITNNSKHPDYCKLPLCLSNFRNVEYLRLQFVDIDQLQIIKHLPIENLVLENVKYSSKEEIINIINYMEHLKTVSCDNSVFKELKDSLKNNNVKVELVDSN